MITELSEKNTDVVAKRRFDAPEKMMIGTKTRVDTLSEPRERDGCLSS